MDHESEIKVEMKTPRRVRGNQHVNRTRTR